MSTATLPTPSNASAPDLASSVPPATLATPALHSIPTTARTRDSKPQTPPTAAAASPLRLVAWARDHEVRPSRRTWETLDRVSLSTRHDSLGFRALAAQPDAAGLLAAWTLLLQITARLPRPLRGYLVAPHGYAYTVDDLALMTGFPAPFFARALAFFQSPEVGWLAPATLEAIPLALQEIEDHRLDEDYREAERAALADQRRRERRAARSRSAEARSAASPDPSSEFPSPASDFPPENSDPCPEPSPDWRTRILAVMPPDDTDSRDFVQTVAWSELSPAFRNKVLQILARHQPR